MSESLVYPPLSGVDTTARYTLGTTMMDGSGNEFVYLQGVLGTVVGSCVSYNPATFATALSVVGVAARLAFAVSATVASTYGWYCIKGTCACVTLTSIAATGAAVYLTATAGSVDDAIVATDRVENAYFTTLTTPAGSVSIIYPTTTNA